MVFSVFWAIAIGILILVLVFSLKGVEPAYGTLAGIAGGVLGWLLGMYVSPEGTTEQQQFAKIGTAIVALFSGYTLKVVIDWLSKEENKGYRIYCGLVLLSAAVSMAAVYNTRAYGNTIVKISFPSTSADKDKQKATVGATKEILFTAAVEGVPDTSVKWEIVPKVGSTEATNDAKILTDGRFTASTPDTYKVLARSNYDPKLADTVDVIVTK
jgi:hypothetical protein